MSPAKTARTNPDTAPVRPGNSQNATARWHRQASDTADLNSKKQARKCRSAFAARGPLHFFSTSLVDSPFATLEPPTGEPGVLRVDALAPLSQLQAEVTCWLAAKEQ